MTPKPAVNEFSIRCTCPQCACIWLIEGPSRAIAARYADELLSIPCRPCRRLAARPRGEA